MEATHGVSVCSGWSDASSPRAALDAVFGSKDLTGASLGIVFASADYDLDGLAAALDALSAGQERLLDLADKREEAIRKARPAALADTLREETEEIRTIAGLDAARSEQAEWFASRLGLPQGQRPRASWIASRLPASMKREKQRIEKSAEGLRERIERVARRTASDRLSAERLAQHMRGLIETASAQLGTSTGYGSRGERRRAPAAPVGIDLTS